MQPVIRMYLYGHCTCMRRFHARENKAIQGRPMQTSGSSFSPLPKASFPSLSGIFVYHFKILKSTDQKDWFIRQLVGEHEVRTQTNFFVEELKFQLLNIKGGREGRRGSPVTLVGKQGVPGKHQPSWQYGERLDNKW